MINLPDNQLRIVQDILHRYIPDRKVVVFGSRTTDKIKPYSDLDLCVMGDTPLSLSTSADLTEAFSESDLPVKVDIVHWATTGKSFRKIIKEQAVVIQAGAKAGTLR